MNYPWRDVIYGCSLRKQGQQLHFTTLTKLHIFFSEKPHELDVKRFSAHNTTCGNDTFPRGFGQKVNTGVNSIKQTYFGINYIKMFCLFFKDAQASLKWTINFFKIKSDGFNNLNYIHFIGLTQKLKFQVQIQSSDSLHTSKYC